MKKRLNKLIALSGIRGRLQKNKFESNGFFYYSGQRATFTEALTYIKGAGRALDIGAGFGNEVKVLLKRGFEVIATDSNPEAVEYLKKLARKKPKLAVVQESLPALSASGSFDLAVCEMVLHFLTKNELKKSLEKIQHVTKSGGLNVISTYVEHSKFHTDPIIKPGHFKGLLDEGELKELYKNWDILYYEEKSNTLGFPSARIIARKY